jgi:hypothetical protein
MRSHRDILVALPKGHDWPAVVVPNPRWPCRAVSTARNHIAVGRESLYSPDVDLVVVTAGAEPLGCQS